MLLWLECVFIHAQPPEGWNGGVGFVSKEMIQTHCPPPATDIQVNVKLLVSLPLNLFDSGNQTESNHPYCCRYWGAGHRPWTRPWQVTLRLLDTLPKCSSSSEVPCGVCHSLTMPHLSLGWPCCSYLFL